MGTGGHDFEVAAIAAFLRSSSEEIASAASDEEQITTEVADSSYTGDGSQESAAEAIAFLRSSSEAAIAFLRSSSEERAPADPGEERVPTEVEADDSSLDVDLPQEWVHSSDEAAEIADILRSSSEEVLLPSPASSRHSLDEPEPEESPIVDAVAPGDAAGDSPVSLESVECAHAEGSPSAQTLMDLVAMLSEALVAQPGAMPPLHAGLPQPGEMPPPQPGAMPQAGAMPPLHAGLPQSGEMPPPQPGAMPPLHAGLPQPGAMQPVAPQMAQMSQMSSGDRQVRRREH